MNIGSDKKKKTYLYIIFNWDYVRQQKIISHTIVITLKIYIFLTTQRKKAYWINIFLIFIIIKAPLNVKYVASKSKKKLIIIKASRIGLSFFTIWNGKRRLGWFVRTLRSSCYIWKNFVRKRNKAKKIFHLISIQWLLPPIFSF